MKQLTVRIICLIICLAIALFCFGCSSQSETESSSSSKKSETSSQTSSSSKPSDDNAGTSSENDGWISSDENTSSEDNNTDTDPDNGGNTDYTDEPIFDDVLEVKTKISNTTPLSTRYMGSGSGVYFCFGYMDDAYGRCATDEQLKIEMDRLENIGIHTVRSIFKFSWAEKTAGAGDWNWESDDMKAVYRWMGEMKKRNIDVMLNPWSFSWIYGGDSSIPDTSYFNTDNFTVNSTRWCNAVAELYKQMYARGYNNAKYFVMFTEPIYSNEISEQTYSWYIENANRLHATLTEAGIRKNIQVVGPNRSDDNTDLVIRCFKEAYDAFDIFSHHRYISAADLTSDTYADDVMLKWGAYVENMKAVGMGAKPYWVDEWGIQDQSQTSAGYSNVGFDEPLRGVQQAVAITVGMNLGIDNMLLWTLADQQWPNQRNTGTSAGFYDGVMVHGIFDNIQSTLVPKTQYYSYSLLSKFTGRGGGKTYYSAPYSDYGYWGVNIACVQTREGEWTIIVTNTNMEHVRCTIDIEKSLGGVKLYRHQYVAHEVQPNIAAQIIPANKTITNVTNGFTDILRPWSVAVYTTMKLNS